MNDNLKYPPVTFPAAEGKSKGKGHRKYGYYAQWTTKVDALEEMSVE